MNKLLKRSLSGIVLLIIIYFALSLGGTSLALFTFVLSVVGFKEYSDAFKTKDIEVLKLTGYLSSFLYLIKNLKLTNMSYTFIIFISLIFSLFVLVLDQKIDVIDISLTILGSLYIPFLFQHIFLLDGQKYIWLIFLTAWGSDTFAYLVGNLFGKRKLYPELSPNKTVEGSLGGIIGSGVLCILFGIYIKSSNLIILFLLGSFCSIISQLGDLTASKIKRYTGVKDFGYIIPGHGGILDRFDSILFTGPIIYYLYWLVG